MFTAAGILPASGSTLPRMSAVVPAPRPAASRLFHVLWAFDAIVAAVVVLFFLWGLSDGSVSSFNMGLWLGLLAVVGAVVGGSRALHLSGHTKTATMLLLVVAAPGLAFCLFFAAVLLLQPRWN